MNKLEKKLNEKLEEGERVAILTRRKFIDDRANVHPVLGMLQLSWEPWLLLHTLESPWVNNRKFVSCIPKGGPYTAVFVNSEKHGGCYEIIDVPRRKNIYIYAGKYTETDVMGSIIPGCRLSQERCGCGCGYVSDMIIENSDRAMRMIVDEDYEDFSLFIF